MNRKITKTASNIKRMKIQGAINIALAAAKALRVLIKESRAETKEEFIKELHSAGRELIETRPTAVALPNIIHNFIGEVEKTRGNLENVKKEALEISKKILLETKNSVKKIGKIGSALVKNNSTILIHCHSGTVIEILKEAKRQKKDFKVICTETRPWRQGFISARELSKAGIRTTLIVDSAAMSFMPSVDLVFVGADAVLRDGKIVNKIGTSQIALIAKHFKKPFYVATQTLKFSNSNKVEIEERNISEILEDRKLPGVEVRNPVFDITERKFITGIITEKGVKSWHF